MLHAIEMKHLPGGLLCTVCALFVAASGAAAGARAEAQAAQAPRVFLLDGQHLQATKERIRNGDKSFAAALASLETDAEEALSIAPLSVANKDATPPSGDKRDYMSQAPYFWPDPNTSNGLPYIRRDGERNREIDKFPNHRQLDQLVDAVETLALAYYFKADEKFGAKAATLLRVFFVESKTRMNPHLQYAQGIPGINTGRGIGLIETRGLTRLVDAVGLLNGCKAWTLSDQRSLEAWFSEFLRWMLESQNGREEAAAKNNHGTYYDLQAVSFALFVRRNDLATNILLAAREKRIAQQIEPDGRQPFELARTKAWSYSLGNLQGLMSLARLGENAGVDLWNYQTADGRSIRKAIDYLMSFAVGDQEWPHQQLGGWSAEGIHAVLRRAAPKYPSAPYRAIVLKRPDPDLTGRTRLLRPPLTEKENSLKAIPAGSPPSGITGADCRVRGRRA